MTDRLKEIQKQLLSYWNKYTGKQKTIIVSVISTIMIAFLLLIYLMGRTEYEKLTVCETPSDTSKVVELLKEEGISYEIEPDQRTISVDLKRYSDAILLLASNDMPSTGLSVDELLNNSLSTTNSDRTLKINLYIQNQLRNYLKTMTGVKDAQVYYIPVENSNSILATIQETSASVLLTVTDEFDVRTAQTIAEVVASVIGNPNTDKIKVADQNGTLLFGGKQDLYSGSASSNEDYKERLRNTFINNLYMGLIKSGYDDVEIMPNLVFNMDKISELFTEYLPTEGEDQGLQGRYYSYNSENAGSSGGGIPGTSANDGTDYMMPDGSSSSGTVEIEEIDYLPNERITNTEFEVGAVIPEESSISIVLRKINTIKEEELEMSGLLEDISFEEYALQNNEREKVEVDPEIITMVSMATGISESNIQVLAYEQPLFLPLEEAEGWDWTDYIQPVLAVLIVGLLIFVVLKGIAPVKVTEMEPELSVEQLLATTKENQTIEDIDYNEGSEVRKMIEKFVDEKPDAVAQLLRNWLNEDWD